MSLAATPGLDEEVLRQQSSAGPLFVVGVWRSGTSLLQALLNQHPMIGLAYEAELPLLKSLFLGGHAKRDWLERWDFWNRALERHRIAPQLGSRDYDLRSATETVYRSFAARKGAVIWGEKSPNYWDRLEQMAKDFPNAKFIIIWRDPAGICRSIAKAAHKESFFAKPGMCMRALFACRQLKRQRDLLVQKGTPLYEIQYELMVKDPTTVLKGVCKFLGIPFEPRMSSLENADRGSFYEGEHHAAVKGDRIVSTQDRPEILNPEFRAKIESYVALWRSETAGQWPLYPLKPLQSEAQPTFGPRLKDSVHFWLLRKLDSVVAFTYCWAPFWFLNTRRSWKKRAIALVRTPESAPDGK